MENRSEGDGHLEPGQRTNTTLTVTPTQMVGEGGKVLLPALGSTQPLLGNPCLTLPWTAPGLYQAVREMRADQSS